VKNFIDDRIDKVADVNKFQYRINQKNETDRMVSNIAPEVQYLMEQRILENASRICFGSYVDEYARSVGVSLGVATPTSLSPDSAEMLRNLSSTSKKRSRKTNGGPLNPEKRQKIAKEDKNHFIKQNVQLLFDSIPMG
jgi:hypothetical protein